MGVMFCKYLEVWEKLVGEWLISGCHLDGVKKQLLVCRAAATGPDQSRGLWGHEKVLKSHWAFLSTECLVSRGRAAVTF